MYLYGAYVLHTRVCYGLQSVYVYMKCICTYEYLRLHMWFARVPHVFGPVSSGVNMHMYASDTCMIHVYTAFRRS